MAIYVFTVYMTGEGDDEMSAWQDAVHAFSENPVFPDKDQIRIHDEKKPEQSDYERSGEELLLRAVESDDPEGFISEAIANRAFHLPPFVRAAERLKKTNPKVAEFVERLLHSEGELLPSQVTKLKDETARIVAAADGVEPLPYEMVREKVEEWSVEECLEQFPDDIDEVTERLGFNPYGEPEPDEEDE